MGLTGAVRDHVSVMQDLPHGGGGDVMDEPDQFTLHAPMSPGGFSAAMPITSLLIAAAVGDARVGDVPSSSISARPPFGAKPGLWQE